MPIIDIQQAQAEIGRVRIGIKKVSQNGKEYPAKLDTFRLTSENRAVLEDCARVFGGEVHEWAGHKGEFELLTERKHIQVLLSGEHSLSQDYEQWIGGGWTHRCDGQTCTRRSKEGAEWEEACSCAPIKADWDRHRAQHEAALKEWEKAGKRGRAPALPIICKPTSRLTFMLTEINSTGRWLFTSGGKIFASEIAGHFATCEALGLPKFLFCILTLEEEEIKKPGRQPEKFPVVRVALDPNPPNFLGRIVSLVQSSQYVLPSGEQAPALGGGQQSLPGRSPEPPAKKSNADLAKAHGLTPEQYREIVEKAKAKYPKRSVGDFLQETYTDGIVGYEALLGELKEGAEPGVQNAEFTPVDEGPDAELEAYLLKALELPSLVDEFKEAAGDRWRARAGKAKATGATSYQDLMAIARDPFGDDDGAPAQGAML